MGDYSYGGVTRGYMAQKATSVIAGHDDHGNDEWILPVSPAPAPSRTAVQREADTQMWERYVSDETQARIMTSARVTARADARRRLFIRIFCALLSIGLLIFGLSGLIEAGVGVGAHGLELAALVMGGGTLVALMYALTES